MKFDALVASQYTFFSSLLQPTVFTPRLTRASQARRIIIVMI